MPIVESPDAPAETTIVRPLGRARELPPRRRIRMLSVSADYEDHDILSGILENTIWQLVTAATCQEAIGRLNRLRVAAILCEYTLGDGSWKDVLDHCLRNAKPVPVIVTSRLADEHLWAEVLNLGGYDVLAKPFREREVVHTVTSALLHGARATPRVRAAGG
jgi:DNA-binding NtrC family response regulator